MECPEYLISAIIGYEKSATTWQMKYGINSEIHAKTKYKPLTKNSHKGITYQISKLTCHGPGLVEIKCPASLIAKTANV